MTESNSPSALQIFPWPSMVAAVKRSADYGTFEAFYASLTDSLPQNSPLTRVRLTSIIIRNYFPGRSLDSLATRVWRAYGRDDLLTDIMRDMTLEAEPVTARFVVEQLLVLPPGSTFDRARARDYIGATYGRFCKTSYSRLLIRARYLGFLTRRGKDLLVAAVPRPADAFLILLHARLAPTPRIVRVPDILSAPFWQYLGMRSPEEVRSVLRDADAAGILARYAIVDELEQVTTRYPFEEYLSRRVAL